MKARTALILAPPIATFYTIGVMANFLPLYARSLGASYAVVGLLSTAFFASSTPASLILGRMADRLGGVRVILSASMLANAAVLYLMAVTREASLLALLRLVQGVALSATIPLSMVAAAGDLGVHGSVGATGVLSGVGFTLGGVAGGFLSASLGYGGAFISAALVSLASAFLALGYSSSINAPRVPGGWISDLREIPLMLWFMYAALFVRQLGASGVFAVLPVYMKEHLGAPDQAVGTILSLNPLAQAFFIYALSRLKAASMLLYSAGLSLTGLVFIGYIAAPTYLWVAPVQVLLGLAWSLIDVAGYVLIMHHASSRVKYTATSMFNTVFNAAWIIGAFLGGVFADMYGAAAWMMLATLLALLGGGMVLLTPKGNCS